MCIREDNITQTFKRGKMLSPHACPFYPLAGIIIETERQKTQKKIRVNNEKIALTLSIPEEKIILKEEREQAPTHQQSINVKIQTNIDKTNQENWIKI